MPKSPQWIISGMRFTAPVTKLNHYLPGLALATFLILLTGVTLAHEHSPVTHSFNEIAEPDGLKLFIDILDRNTGRPTPARFSIQVDGEPHFPGWVGDNGISFTSIHLRSNHRSTMQFSKGLGPVAVSLPAGTKEVTVSVAKGFEYFAESVSVAVSGQETNASIELERWVNLKADGWIAIDEHLHFDRLTAEDDEKWFSMFEADGLETGHFMVLKGGMTPGVWSSQFAYGSAGEGTDGDHMLIPGQEYRDNQQGHINLLGLDEVILPYSTGGLGTPAVNENYPPLYDVLEEARNRNGFAGVAHGGTLGRHSVSLADAVMGAVDFWEVSNGFIYDTENWYRLMNCGIFLPMAAGTDLPNSPYRDDWQPMFGAIRTYVNTGGDLSFDGFKEAMRAGRSFISGGPMIDFQVEGQSMGGTLYLPEGGGTVTVRAAVHSPLRLRKLMIVKDGEDLAANVRKRKIDGVNRWSIETDIEITESGWISAWGQGAAIEAQGFDAMAHAGVIRVIVGDQPVHSAEDAEIMVRSFEALADFYQSSGVYQSNEDRERAVGLFQQAIRKLRPQID